MDGRLMGFIKAWAAAKDNADKALMTARNKAQSFRNGQYQQGGRVPFGCRRHYRHPERVDHKEPYFVIDPAEAGWVRCIFEWYAIGDPGDPVPTH